MKLRSIPDKTGVTLARERKIKDEIPPLEIEKKPSNAIGKRGKMRQQISRKPFEEKLAKWQEELDELSQWADEGIDVSKIKSGIERNIEELLDLLEGK